MPTQYFTVAEIGGPIWGTGRTEQEALNNAKNYAATMYLVEYLPEARDGDMVTIPCSQALYFQVEQDGGNIGYEIVGEGNSMRAVTEKEAGLHTAMPRYRRFAADEEPEEDLEEEADDEFEEDLEDVMDEEDVEEDEDLSEEDFPEDEPVEEGPADYSDVPSVFLGGTTSSSTWREDLIEMLDIGYFNPVVDNWDEDAQENERYWRDHCDFVLYCITPEMEGVYSIAEVVDDANKRPEKAIFCYLGDFPEKMLNSIEAVAKLVTSSGAQVFTSLKDVAEYLNAGSMPDEESDLDFI